MGGGDSLYDKIDKGVRGCKVVVSCVTTKYSLSVNCRREIMLADGMEKPIIPLLLEKLPWPPEGPFSVVFSDLKYLDFTSNTDTLWDGKVYDDLLRRINQYIPDLTLNTRQKYRLLKKIPAMIEIPTASFNYEHEKSMDEEQAGTNDMRTESDSDTDSSEHETAKDEGSNLLGQDTGETNSKVIPLSDTKITGQTEVESQTGMIREDLYKSMMDEIEEQDREETNTNNPAKENETERNTSKHAEEDENSNIPVKHVIGEAESQCETSQTEHHSNETEYCKTPNQHHQKPLECDSLAVQYYSPTSPEDSNKFERENIETSEVQHDELVQNEPVKSDGKEPVVESKLTEYVEKYKNANFKDKETGKKGKKKCIIS